MYYKIRCLMIVFLTIVSMLKVSDSFGGEQASIHGSSAYILSDRGVLACQIDSHGAFINCKVSVSIKSDDLQLDRQHNRAFILNGGNIDVCTISPNHVFDHCKDSGAILTDEKVLPGEMGLDAKHHVMYIANNDPFSLKHIITACHVNEQGMLTNCIDTGAVGKNYRAIKVDTEHSLIYFSSESDSTVNVCHGDDHGNLSQCRQSKLSGEGIITDINLDLQHARIYFAIDSFLGGKVFMCSLKNDGSFSQCQTAVHYQKLDMLRSISFDYEHAKAYLLSLGSPGRMQQKMYTCDVGTLGSLNGCMPSIVNTMYSPCSHYTQINVIDDSDKK